MKNAEKELSVDIKPCEDDGFELKAPLGAENSARTPVRKARSFVMLRSYEVDAIYRFLNMAEKAISNIKEVVNKSQDD